jgi:hypothetical protein
MVAITPPRRRLSRWVPVRWHEWVHVCPRHWLIVGALALAGWASLPAGVDAAPASETIGCTSGRSGFDFCKRSKYYVKKCRKVSVTILDSGDNRWVKVQVRKSGEDSARWESAKLRPTESDSGRIAGRDRFRPSIWVDADTYTRTDVTMRLRYSGRGC